MRAAFSLGLFILLMVIVAMALLIVARNELETKDKVTGGYGLLAVFGFMVVFLVMPVFAYFIRF